MERILLTDEQIASVLRQYIMPENLGVIQSISLSGRFGAEVVVRCHYGIDAVVFYEAMYRAISELYRLDFSGSISWLFDGTAHRLTV